MLSKMNLVVLLLLVATLPLVGACAKTEAPQPKAEIVVGHFDDFSDGMAYSGQEAAPGLADAARYINEGGGILGHPIRIVTQDHKMDSKEAIPTWDNIKAAGAVVVYCGSGPIFAPVWEFCQRDSIPVISAGGTVDQTFPVQPSFFFPNNPNIVQYHESFANQVEKLWAKKGETRPPRIACEIIAMGTYPKMLGKAAKMAMEKRGWPYILVPTSPMAQDVTTQVLQIKDFKTDIFYEWGSASGAINYSKELNRQGLHPVVFAGTSAGSQEVYNGVGKLVVGWIPQQTSVRWEDTDIKLVQLVHDLNAKWHPEVTVRPTEYMRVFSDFMVISEALKRAVQKVGYEKLDGVAVKDALETISNFDPGIGTGYTFTPNDHQGIHGTAWYQWQEDGTMKRYSDWDIFPPSPQEQRTNAWWLN